MLVRGVPRTLARWQRVATVSRSESWSGWELAAESRMIRGGSMRDSARRMLVSTVCVLGLAAAAAPVLSTAAASPAAASAAAGSVSHPTPGLYHQPIIGKVVIPGLGQVLGHGLRHATNVQSQ